MNIVMREMKHGIHFEALCDLCREPMDMTETVAYVTPPTGEKAQPWDDSGLPYPFTEDGSDIVCHFKCYRKRTPPGWSKMTSVEHLIEKLIDRHRNRHPALAAFIKTLKDQKPHTDPLT